MDNALYYTFSTIAQALAAAMALLAAFAMYRLNSINDECKGAADTIIDSTGGGFALRKHYNVSDWEGFLLATKERETPEGLAVPATALSMQRLRQLMDVAKAVRRALWLSLGVTAVVIVGSVWVLAYVPSLGEQAKRQLLGAGVVAFALCLVAYGWLMVVAFREPTARLR